jgi:hypothetical protein
MDISTERATVAFVYSRLNISIKAKNLLFPSGVTMIGRWYRSLTQSHAFMMGPHRLIPFLPLYLFYNVYRMVVALQAVCVQT